MDSGVKSLFCQYFTQYLWATNTIILNLSSFTTQTFTKCLLFVNPCAVFESIMGNMERKSVTSKHGKKLTIGLWSTFRIYNTIKNLEGIFENPKKKNTKKQLMPQFYILSLPIYHLPILCSLPPKPQRFFCYLLLTRVISSRRPSLLIP